jgi:hypothetical protein
MFQLIKLLFIFIRMCSCWALMKFPLWKRFSIQIGLAVTGASTQASDFDWVAYFCEGIYRILLDTFWDLPFSMPLWCRLISSSWRLGDTSLLDFNLGKFLLYLAEGLKNTAETAVWAQKYICSKFGWEWGLRFFF